MDFYPREKTSYIKLKRFPSKKLSKSKIYNPMTNPYYSTTSTAISPKLTIKNRSFDIISHKV